MSRPGISVMINTYNEEKRLESCLRSVRWADEIVVVDMESTDKTREIAREFTAKIFVVPNVGYADPARQFALDQTTQPWVLMLDADELVTRGLRETLERVAAEDRYDAVSIPHRNFFFGQEMKGGGLGPLQNMHVRFFRRGALTYSHHLHAFTHVRSGARVLALKDPRCAFVHLCYPDIDNLMQKVNFYTTIEARTRFGQAGRRSGWRRLLMEVLREILLYFRTRGRKDGFLGTFYRATMIYYRIATTAKVRMMRRYGTDRPRDAVEHQYAGMASSIVSETGGEASEP